MRLGISFGSWNKHIYFQRRFKSSIFEVSNGISSVLILKVIINDTLFNCESHTTVI